MYRNSPSRHWLCALLLLWAAAAGAFSDAAAYVEPSAPSTVTGAAAPLDDREGGAAGRSIVVLSDNVSITLAKGTFGTGLEPFEPGDASFRADRPLNLVGQLVDGNYTLLAHGGGREAALRNRGIAGHGETVRWWFNGVEQPPLPVVWRPPDSADEGLINGTFFVRDWVIDRTLAPAAGTYSMRFSFAGTRLSYPGLGEFLVYPPSEPAPMDVTVVLPTETSALPFGGPVDAGRTVELRGSVRAQDGARPSGSIVVSDGERTLGPPLPGGLFIDEVEVSVPGIPAVLYREGFEAGGAGWTAGGEGADWSAGAPAAGPEAYRGGSCLGTGLRGPYSHLADEWVDSPSIDLSRFPSEARLSFALWHELAPGDSGWVRVWNGSDWSDPVAIGGTPSGLWSTVTIELWDLRCRGAPFPVSGTPDLRLRWGLRSATPSARLVDGAFSMDWTVPADSPAGPVFLSFRCVPAGPYLRSWGNLKADVRAATHFELPSAGGIQAAPGGWAELRGRLLDANGRPLDLPLGRPGGGGLRAFWDDGRGNVTEAESVSGSNATGDFACARLLPAGGSAEGASFILRFGGTESYQPAEAVVPCAVVGLARFVLDATKAAAPGGEFDVSGRLLMGDRPAAGAVVSVSSPMMNLSLTTGALGDFSGLLRVPAGWAGSSLRVDFSFAGGPVEGLGRLGPASGSLDAPVLRKLSLVFPGGELEKGRPALTTLDGQRFRGLAGRVLDASGAGAPGVEVAFRAFRPGGMELLGTALSGEAGYFSLDWSPGWSEPSGELGVEAAAALPASGAAVRTAVFNITARTVLRLDALPPLQAGGWADVTGTLSEDRDGAPGDPVRDAAVAVSFAGRTYTAVTDQAGRFRVRCPVDRTAGNISVGASFPGAGGAGASSAASAAVLRAVESGGGSLRPSTGVPVMLGRAVSAGSFLAAAAGAALIAGTESGRFKLMLALVPLYSKIRKEEVLDQFVRGQVFGYIQANPGDHYSSIRQTLKLKNGTLAYHLRTLERESFVFSRMDGIFRRFYPTGLDPARVRVRGSVRETHRRILELIDGSPGITPKELAGKLGASHQVASYHVRLLARKGLIRLEQRGRNTLCFTAGGGPSGGAGH
jgi:DNA-binding MarR family transcriptional regulator